MTQAERPSSDFPACSRRPSLRRLRQARGGCVQGGDYVAFNRTRGCRPCRWSAFARQPASSRKGWRGRRRWIGFDQPRCHVVSATGDVGAGWHACDHAFRRCAHAIDAAHQDDDDTGAAHKHYELRTVRQTRVRIAERVVLEEKVGALPGVIGVDKFSGWMRCSGTLPPLQRPAGLRD